MKPIFQKLTADEREGFNCKDWRARGYECPWHFHPEYELILVLEGGGYRVVGDNVTAIVPGDMAFLGPMLPHIWQNETASKHARPVHQLLLQFETKNFGEELFQLSAMASVRRLLERATRGLQIVGPTRDAVGGMLGEMQTLRGVARLLRFLEILGTMADSDHCHPIASVNFVAHPDRYDQEIMNRIFELLNDEQEIRLPAAARAVGMSEGAFSRFFRLHTGKTFPEFRNELRIGRASRLLSEEDRSITEIAYQCGFANLSNFNRQFLRLKGRSPREYRQQVREILGAAGTPAEKYQFRPERV